MSANKVLILKRTFNAPVKLVWDAWTKPELMQKWWGPRYFTCPKCEIELKPGGKFVADMQGSDGQIYTSGGKVIEVIENQKLVMESYTFPNDEGDFDLKDITTITFEEVNGTTHITLHAEVTKQTPAVQEALAGMEEGWNQSLDKLVEVVTLAK